MGSKEEGGGWGAERKDAEAGGRSVRMGREETREGAGR